MARLLRKTDDGREVYATSAPIEIKAVNIEEGVYDITITTEASDREEDIMRAAGAKTENYMKNPVVLFAHDYRSPPVGTTLKLDIEKRGIRSRFQFLPWGTYDFADTIHRIWDAGALRTASIGYLPEEVRPIEDSKKGGRDFTKWELLEWSIVTVPMNPQALRRALDAMDDEIEPIPEEKPYPNEHACRLRNPDDFQPDTFRRTSRTHEGKEYSVIMGRLKNETTMTEQAYRYAKDTWTAAQAGSHCKAHDGRFEAASGERDASCLNDAEHYLTNNADDYLAAADDQPNPKDIDITDDVQPTDELTDDEWDQIAEALLEILKLDNLRRFIK